jgi:hypothetical protein
MAWNLSLEQGMIIRAVAGSASLYFMIFLSIFGGKKLFPVLKSWGLLPNAGAASD